MSPLLKETEAVSRMEPELIQKIINNFSPPLICFSKEEGKALLINTPFTELFGYTLQGIPDLSSWLKLVSPDGGYPYELKEIYESFYNKDYPGQGRFSPVKVSVEGKNKVKHSVEMEIASFGKYILFTYRDLTKQSQWMIDLIQSENKYKALFEESLDGLFITSPAGKILDMNKKGVELFGYDTKDEILKLDLVKDIYEYPLDRQRILEMVNSQGTAEYDVVVKRKNGEKIITHCSLTVERDESGKIITYRGVIRDVTEKVKGDIVIKQSEERKTVLNKIASIFLTVPDEMMYGEILSVILEKMNSRFGVFGYIERNGDFIVPSMTRDVWKECQVPDKSIVFSPDAWGNSLWGKAIRDRKSYLSEGPFHVPHGHIAIVDFLTVPIVYNDETIGLISVANKKAGYTEDDKDLLESITTYISPILKARLQRNWEEQDRMAVEEAKLASEVLLNEAQHFAHFGSWELNLVTNKLWWSDEIYRIFEVDSQTFGASYECFLETIHPDDRELVDKIYTESVRNKTPYDIVIVCYFLMGGLSM